MDRAYEDNKTRALAEEHGFNVVVPPKKNRKDPWEYDKELYKKRNQVERYFLTICAPFPCKVSILSSPLTH